jgi:phosphoglycolate phosphatase-like HAD superfamily hydrolase
LAKAIDAAEDEDAKLILQKALQWSLAVNESITRLPEELKIPFPGAAAGLAAAAKIADVAVVSSANRDAVEEEWEKYGLLANTDILLAQDCGSKAHCISEMLKFGYEKDHVLMVGDAPGDCDAAEKNGVWFYPILVNWEEESWTEFVEKALPMFVKSGYSACQAEKKQVFVENLGG